MAAGAMRLSELEPRWLETAGQRIGVVFLCPHCRKTPVSCFWVPTTYICGDDDDSQYGLFDRLLPTFGEAYATFGANDVVPCRRGYAWGKTGDDFETLTITPSIDASASGHWHGHITSGEIR
jgi:hypothetical protein